MKKLKRMEGFDVITNIIVFILAIMFLLPLFWLLTNTFKTSSGIYQMPPDILPKQWYLGNLAELFKGQPTLRWIFNSFVVSFLTALLSVYISALAAYGFSKLQFKGKTVLFIIVIASIMIPKETFIVPLFDIIEKLHWVDTYQSMVVPNLATGFGTFMLYSYFKVIPESIRESAKLDGASEWTIFTKLMFPIVKPGIGALFILNFVTAWNDYLWQLLMARSKEMKTLTIGVASLQQDINPNIGLKVAGAAIAALPMIVIFFLFQRFFIKGATDGALKE
ncbi:carbohydrate ABC transporter permease [Streptococcus pseudoporcinus]|uniref:ABC transporter, permease protein n=2 Tax=Streptococcus pseudoporcinus TaxID=361101 RepID=G5K884_9STRE|nr:carbohydrate ABC transporter permease [Streptococcus pseudoporcinus]EFR44898.1 ABC transporter, permease protein [Streptococcus pseudoporcinus SPIN 20026]EHI64223.1 ABC transporter, permease protein [Streptococcus pseudoporcinus LQ 940-04]VEF94029.1 ABC transporter, permease protein [Streptococcus pseudoporcinus]VTS24256.1 ABC transporter, permease protein [Streptococcus pseudoporcinus]VUC70968.1 ABC transporter, permease protein [Streptococcus pseudoporcinus]